MLGDAELLGLVVLGLLGVGELEAREERDGLGEVGLTHKFVFEL